MSSPYTNTNTAMFVKFCAPFQGSYGTFLAAAVNLPLKGNALRQGYIGYGGRKLLQVGLASGTGNLN